MEAGAGDGAAGRAERAGNVWIRAGIGAHFRGVARIAGRSARSGFS